MRRYYILSSQTYVGPNKVLQLYVVNLGIEL